MKLRQNFSEKSPWVLQGWLLCVMAVVMMCAGCARPRPAPLERPDLNTPLSFEVAVRMVAYDLFVQVANQDSVAKRRRGRKPPANFTFVTDKVINADTGDELTLNPKIAEIISSTAQQSFANFSIMAMNPETLARADYVIIGVVKQEPYNASTGKFPHLLLSIVDMKTGKVKAHSEVWIANKDLELLPTPLYSDSPMYINDARVKALIATALATSGSSVDKEYFGSLGTTALLAEASQAYDAGDYKLAVGLFGKAAEREDGLTMKTFAGLYQSFLKLQSLKEAEDAFAKLTEIGIRNGNLSAKFLFKVNDTSFFGEPDEITEYEIWIRQLANEIQKSNSCIEISGHASHSGSPTHNKKLSQQRAESIKDRLQRISAGVAGKTTAIGKGFEENIVGTGTDDIRDAIDRRVEFKVVPCI